MLRTCTKKTQTSQNLSIRFPDCRFTLDSVFFLFSSIFFTLGHFAFLKTFSGREINRKPITQESAVAPCQRVWNMLEITDANSRI